MVTIEQTREQFLFALNSNAYLNVCTADDMKNAIVALDKQIAKNPIKLEYKLLLDAGWEYGCPTCNCAVGVNRFARECTQEDEWCPSCGQRIGW